MNAQYLRQWVRGVRLMTSLHGWKKTFSLGSQGEPFKVIDVSSFAGRHVAVIAPHPDDEIFGCGGTLSQISKFVPEITVIYLTNGVHGTPSGRTDAKLREIRSQEAVAGLKCLEGNYKTYFYDNDDGGNFVSAALEKKLLKDLKDLEINCVFLPWFGDDNLDHLQAGKLFYRICHQLPEEIKIWQYEIWSPLISNCYVPIGQALDAKKKAIQAHKSQLSSREYQDGIIGLNQYRAVQANLPQAAEAFLVLKLPAYQEMFRHYQPFV